jgi:hypothetical protein
MPKKTNLHTNSLNKLLFCSNDSNKMCNVVIKGGPDENVYLMKNLVPVLCILFFTMDVKMD